MLPGAEKRKTGGQSIYLQTLGIVVDMNSLIITTTFMQSSVVHGWLMWVADSMYHGCTNFLEEQATVSITNELLHSKLITSCVNQYVCGLRLGDWIFTVLTIWYLFRWGRGAVFI